VNAVSVAIPLAWLIMIAEKIVGLPAGRVPVDFIQQPAEIRRGEFVDVGNLKIHRQLDFIVLAAIHFREFSDIRLVASLIRTASPGYSFATLLISRST